MAAQASKPRKNSAPTETTMATTPISTSRARVLHGIWFFQTLGAGPAGRMFGYWTQLT